MNGFIPLSPSTGAEGSLKPCLTSPAGRSVGWWCCRWMTRPNPILTGPEPPAFVRRSSVLILHFGLAETFSLGFHSFSRARRVTPQLRMGFCSGNVYRSGTDRRLFWEHDEMWVLLCIEQRVMYWLVGISVVYRIIPRDDGVWNWTRLSHDNVGSGRILPKPPTTDTNSE